MRFLTLVALFSFLNGSCQHSTQVETNPKKTGYLNPSRLEILHTLEMGVYSRILIC